MSANAVPRKDATIATVSMELEAVVIPVSARELSPQRRFAALHDFLCFGNIHVLRRCSIRCRERFRQRRRRANLQAKFARKVKRHGRV